MTTLGRRTLLGSAVGTAAALALGRRALGREGGDELQAEIERRHGETVERIQRWIRQPSIAAEHRGVREGCELTIELLREAGFQKAAKVPTDGQPGIFATLDAGAERTLGLYFMYDVKQANPAEWSSPPWEAQLVDLPQIGKVVMGRGATNQKGPEGTFLAALHAIRGAGRKLPVNLVLVAEGEEEIGSPHFPQIVHRPDIAAALAKSVGVFMPMPQQSPDGHVSIGLGAKGVIELELVCTAAKWGRGPRKDIHSGMRARVDSPAFHLVQALATLVTPDGDPAIDGFADKARPLSEFERGLVEETARKSSEATAKKMFGVERWAHDHDWLQSLIDLASRPTVNIEGLVGGYTGQGGMTILPHKAVAKLDLRLVPDMTAKEALEALRAHLAKRGFGDIDVHMTGGYDPTTTPADSPVIKAALGTFKRAGVQASLWPRTAGSWPGYVFTGKPLQLGAGHFGMGHGARAHAPDEYYVIESANPSFTGLDGATRGYVDYLYAIASL